MNPPNIERLLSMVLFAVAIAGCAAGGNPQSGRSGAAVTWSPDVRFPERDPGFESVQRVDGTQMLFTFTEAPALDLAPGQIVTGHQGEGYLARVRDVTWVDHRRVRVTTEAASITDAITDLDLHYESAPSVATGEFDESSEVGAASSALTETLRFRLAPLASLLLSGIDDADVSFEDSYVEIRPDVTADLVIRGGRIQQLHYEVDACIDLRAVVAIDARGDVSAGVSVSPPIGIELPLALGPIPATMSAKPRVTFRVRLAAGSHVRGGIEATACYRAGGHYDGTTGTFTPIFDPGLTVTRVGPELDAGSDVSVELGVGPRVTLYLFGMVGPTVALSDYGRISLSRDEEGLGWAIHGGFEGSVGLDVRVPGGGILSGVRFDHTFPPLERLLASGRLDRSASPDGSMMPECASDADCADVESCDGGTCVRWVECAEDAHCGAGEVCTDYRCVEASGGRSSTGECLSDADCSSLERCDGGSCARWVECTDDTHCGEGARCSSHRCVADSASASCDGLRSGEHGDPCSAEGVWRCACSATWGDISQICRDGIWQSYATSPSDCSTCVGAYDAGCAP
jgi:Cys-rich repeat protein